MPGCWKESSGFCAPCLLGLARCLPLKGGDRRWTPALFREGTVSASWPVSRVHHRQGSRRKGEKPLCQVEAGACSGSCHVSRSCLQPLAGPTAGPGMRLGNRAVICSHCRLWVSPPDLPCSSCFSEYLLYKFLQPSAPMTYCSTRGAAVALRGRVTL